MLGIYFSGTGNTEYIVKRLVSKLDSTGECLALEAENSAKRIEQTDKLVLGYPTQFSNAPLFVRDYIKNNESIWNSKKVLIVATKGAFCGDVTGCSARLLKKFGAEIIGGLQIQMPDSVCDSKALKKTTEANIEIIKKAEQKIDFWAKKIEQGKYPKEGLSFFDHIRGLFGQRLWFYGKTQKYTDKLKISDNCIRCGKCTSVCPMNNLTRKNGEKPVSLGKCAMCYRCISLCPQKAITCIGKEVIEQTRCEKFIL